MRALFVFALLGAHAAAGAAPAVLSAAPDRVAVTLYRDPDRGDDEIDRDEPAAFALIAETRTITLPPGVATVRFEGVAGGIVPQSAILFGADPRERNRDAALLSQKGLVDAFTGQQVVLRRTDPATGKTVTERATIRSAADRMVISTPRGTEAVYCSGLAQTLLYPEAPATLSAKPVLSMTTKNQPGGKVTITLAYIATGFDWDATYIGTLAPDGQSLDLLAWLTMASGDETSFVDATTSAVAGRINRSNETRDNTGQAPREEAEDLDRTWGCWPSGTTSDIRGAFPPPPPAPMMMSMAPSGLEDIIVTAQRRTETPQNVPIAVTAVAENLGDLKLYRIPVPVTVAARSQKQVAFMNKTRISGQLIYRSRVYREPDGPEMLFRFQNRKKDGLGDPLPAGKVAMFQDSGFGRQLIGETAMKDRTTDEEIELVFGEANNVTVETDEEDLKKGRTRYDVTIRNANPFPVHFELEFPQWSDARYNGLPRPVLQKPGKQVWAMLLAPNGEKRISYQVAETYAN